MKNLKYYIKERYNPQLGTYYVRCGQLTKKDAKAMEKSLYGDNFMMEFSCEKEYENKIAELKRNKKSIQ